MFEIIGWIIFSAFIVLFVMAGLVYVQITRRSVNRISSVFNKQENVKRNKDKFGVLCSGASMDGQAIFTASPSDIGV